VAWRSLSFYCYTEEVKYEKNYSYIIIYFSSLFSKTTSYNKSSPIEDNFELKVIASCSLDTTDTTRFIFKYTLISLPTSGQPVRLFKITNDTSFLASEYTDTTIAPQNWEARPRKTQLLLHQIGENLLTKLIGGQTQIFLQIYFQVILYQVLFTKLGDYLM